MEKSDSNITIHTLQSVLANWAGGVKIKQSAINSHRFGQKSPLRDDRASAISEKPRSPNVRQDKGVHHGRRHRPIGHSLSKLTGIFATILLLIPPLESAS